MTHIAGYRIEELVGSGGMGQVWRALSAEGRVVAVKVLRVAFPSVEALRRFRREMQISLRVDHPNIVKAIDAGVHEDQPYIVMEYVAGESLAQRIARAPLSHPSARHLGIQVAGALAYLHEGGMLYRDLKPSNVLITSAEGVRLIDFGLAQALDLTSITRTHEFVGSPRYVPPEVIGGGPYTEASDVYQLGLLLYEGLAGATPFDGDTPAAVFAQITTGSTPPLATKAGDVPPWLERLVTVCLTRDPAHRPASAREVLERLKAGSEGEDSVADYVLPGSLPVPAPVPSEAPPTPSRAAVVSPEQPRGRLGVLSALGLVVALALAYVLLVPRRAQVLAVQTYTAVEGFQVTWRTDRPVATRLRLELPGEADGRLLGSGRASTDHAVAVTGLSPGREYAFQVHDGADWTPAQSAAAGPRWGVQGPEVEYRAEGGVSLRWTSALATRSELTWSAEGHEEVRRDKGFRHAYVVPVPDDGRLAVRLALVDACGKRWEGEETPVEGLIRKVASLGALTDWTALTRAVDAALKARDLDGAQRALDRAGWGRLAVPLLERGPAFLRFGADTGLKRTLLEVCGRLESVDHRYRFHKQRLPFQALSISDVVSREARRELSEELSFPNATVHLDAGPTDLAFTFLPIDFDPAFRERIFEATKWIYHGQDRYWTDWARDFGVPVQAVPGRDVIFDVVFTNLNPTLLFVITLEGTHGERIFRACFHSRDFGDCLGLGFEPLKDASSTQVAPLIRAVKHVPTSFLAAPARRVRVHLESLTGEYVMPAGLKSLRVLTCDG